MAGVAGIPLTACGDDSANVGGAAPAAELGGPTPVPGKTVRPGSRSSAQPMSKSDVYQRGPERPARKLAPEPSTEAVASSNPVDEPTVGTRGGDNLSTARQGDGNGKGRPTATPAPLPPGAFARTSEIPVGGGKTFQDQKVVVTQPTAGTFHGFSANCTHSGCLVDKVEAGQIICPCHGCRFAIADGAVQRGPATVPLPAQAITVGADGSISKA